MHEFLKINYLMVGFFEKATTAPDIGKRNESWKIRVTKNSVINTK